MKVIFAFAAVMSISSFAATNGLLRNRTIERNCKQQLDTLLIAIGAQTIDEAIQKIDQLPELLTMLDSSTITQAFDVLHARGTQQQVANILRAAHVPELSDVENKIKGLPQFLEALHVSTISQAHEVVMPLFDTIASLRKDIRDLEQEHAALVNQCKKVERELNKLGTLIR